MARKEKELAVQTLTEKIRNTSAVVLTEYQGLTVEEISELRNKLRAQKCEYTVVKNTLTRRVLTALGLEEFSKLFKGPSALAIENGDMVEATKVLVQYSKDHKNLKVKAGLLGNRVIDERMVTALAALPPKNVLIAQVLGTMQAPIVSIVSVLSAPLRDFIGVLNAVKEQKEKN